MRNYMAGGSVGGPVRKDRTFYFLAFEKQRFSLGQQGLGTEPSQAYQAAALGYLQKYGVAPNPVATKMMSALWPASALTGPATPNNFFSNDPSYGYSYNGVARLDQKINDKHTLAFRWFAGQGNQVTPTASHLLKWYYKIAPVHVHNFNLVLNSTLTPRLVNQVYFGVNYYNQTFSAFETGFNMRDLGLFMSPSANLPGSPILNISGFDRLGVNPTGRNDITGNLQDTLSYVVGKHQLRFGGEVRQTRLDAFYFSGALGNFTFNGARGPWASDATIKDSHIKALADFLAGYVNTSTLAVGNPERMVRVESYSMFAQDVWQLSRKLTLNLGLRYEYISPFHSSTKDLSTFVASRGGIVFQGAEIDSIYPKDRNNFAPRIGLAYQPGKKGDLVIRGGFGVFYDTNKLQPFLGGSPGIQSNPAGTSPVATVAVNRYTLAPQHLHLPGRRPGLPDRERLRQHALQHLRRGAEPPLALQLQLQPERAEEPRRLGAVADRVRRQPGP